MRGFAARRSARIASAAACAGESLSRATAPLRRLSLTVALLACVALGLTTPAPAFAAPVRQLDSQNPGLKPPTAPFPEPFQEGQPRALALDATGALWVWAGSEEGITKYDPTGGYVTQLTAGGHFSTVGSIAVDHASGDIYVGGAESSEGSEGVAVFSSGGTFLRNIAVNPGRGCSAVDVAVDNSSGATQGRVYAIPGSHCSNTSAIQLFDANGDPVNFTEHASYINGNEITGNPSEPIEGADGIAVDTAGNIYVSGFGFGNGVNEFAPSGKFLRKFIGAEVPEGFGEVNGVAIDPINGRVLLIDDSRYNPGLGEYESAIDEFSPTGEFLDQIVFGSRGPTGSIGFDSGGALYLGVDEGGFHGVNRYLPLGVVRVLPKATTDAASPIERNSATLHGEADPNSGGNITACHFSYIAAAGYAPWADDPYAGAPSSGTAPCLDGSDQEVGTAANPITAATQVHAPIAALTSSTVYHFRLSLTSSEGTARGADRTFETVTAVTDAETGSATDLTNVSATLHGQFTAEEGLETTFYFEYGTSPGYGHKTALGNTPGTAGGTETREITADVADLEPGATYHYRLVAENTHGLSPAENDRNFTTYRAPTIDGISTSDLSATTAILHARINPQGLPAGNEAECHFEYGPTIAYGSTAPCPGPLSGTSSVPVEVELTGLQRGAGYHFRVVAANEWGSVTSEDQSFEFFPPSCPNSAVRQQTGASYLPDCRAYELVSPGNANGTLLFPGGPNTGRATSPSRFAFVGAYSSLPGQNVIDTIGDLYVATRGNNGWTSSYIGPPGSQEGCVGGPPNDPWSRLETSPVKVQERVMTDPGMSRFIDFVDGAPTGCISNNNGVDDASGPLAMASNSGYMWAADGSALGRIPAQLETTQARAALDCPIRTDENQLGGWGQCSGDVATSSDLNHYVFSSSLFNYTAGGSSAEPGGAYDLDLATGTVSRISDLAGGGAIPPGVSSFTQVAAETRNPATFIRFPAISSDGSHILMSNAVSAPLCGNYNTEPCERFTNEPLRLYMSIDDKPAFVVSESETTHEDLAVNYVGMTPDGSRVYFTTAHHMTAENPDHVGASLYMWSAEKAENGEAPLTLISKANPGSPAGAGDTGSCNPVQEWTTACGVTTYNPDYYAEAAAGKGGNGVSDGGLAADGDIYFFSPEQLDGDRGIAGQQNLYDYRGGQLQFVTSFALGDTCPQSPDPGGGGLAFQCAPGSTCLVKAGTVDRGGSESLACSEGPIARMEVAPDDGHMAFVTANRVTSYDNTTASGSCRVGMHGRPSGETHCTEMYYVHARNRRARLQLLQSDGTAPDLRRLRQPGRAIPHRRRPHLLLHRRSARPGRHERRRRCLRVRRRTPAAHHPGHRDGDARQYRKHHRPPAGSRASSGSAPTAPTSTSRPSTSSPPKTTTATSSSSTTRGPTAASCSQHRPALRGRRRMPWPGHRSSASPGARHRRDAQRRKRRRRPSPEAASARSTAGTTVGTGGTIGTADTSGGSASMRRPRSARSLRARRSCVSVRLACLRLRAQASVTIHSFNAIPSTTAGRRPSRLPGQLRTRRVTRASPRPVPATTPKTSTSTCRRVDRQPPQPAPVQRRRSLRPNDCPVDSQLGVAEVGVVASRREASPAPCSSRPSSTWCPPRPSRRCSASRAAGFRHAHLRGCQRPHRQRLRAQRRRRLNRALLSPGRIQAGHLGGPGRPDPRLPPLWPRPIASAGGRLGRRNEICATPTATPAPKTRPASSRPASSTSPANRTSRCRRRNPTRTPERHPRSRPPGLLQQPHRSVPAEPDHLWRTSLARPRDRCPCLRRRRNPRRLPLAADHRLRTARLQPEPGGQPTTDSRRLTLGRRIPPHRPPVREPLGAFALGAARPRVVTLPAGFSSPPTSPTASTPAPTPRPTFGTTEEAQCPEYSKIGTLAVETPVLPGPLPGAVYLGEPKPGNRFRLFLAFDGFGVHVKFAGTVTPDPETGQIQIAFQDLPQAPFADFNMHFFGSERGPLDTPTQCGTYEVKSVFTPWDSALLPETSRQFFTVDEGPDGHALPRRSVVPSHPSFQAASVANTAGAHTRFSLNLTRERRRPEPQLP